MMEFKCDVLYYYLIIDCEIDVFLKMCKELNVKFFEGEGSFKIFVNDFVICVSVFFLMKVFEVNCLFMDEVII